MQGSADANRDGEEKTRQHRPTQKGWDVLRIWGLGWGLGWDVCLSALSHWPSTGKKRLELVLPIIRDTSFRGSVLSKAFPSVWTLTQTSHEKNTH